QVVEEVRDLDAGAFGRADFANGGDDAGVDLDLRAAAWPEHRRRLFAARPCLQREVRDRGDAGQRLAAEAQRADGAEVVGAADLARGVALDGEARILGVHAVAVVFDANQPLAA